MLISFSGRTKQIFFLIIKLEPWLLSWLQPRKNNFAPTELDVSISANEAKLFLKLIFLFLSFIKLWFYKKSFDLKIWERWAICVHCTDLNEYENDSLILETLLPDCIVLHLLRYASRKVLCTQNIWFMRFEFYQQPSVN